MRLVLIKIPTFLQKERYKNADDMSIIFKSWIIYVPGGNNGQVDYKIQDAEKRAD
jgi:hypothetical protein